MANRDFKGIWIPKEVWLSTDLTLQEKLFLVEISSLDNEEGCFASNGYFAEFFGLSKTRVSLVIKSLIDKKYLTSTIIYKEGTKQILKRVLKESYIGYTRKVKEPTQGKLKDNNTVSNTDNNTINKTLGEKLEELNISRKLKDKFIEYIQFRKDIKKSIKTMRTITNSIKKIGKDFKSEEHLIESMDFSMDNEYQGIVPKKSFNNKNNRTEEYVPQEYSEYE